MSPPAGSPVAVLTLESALDVAAGHIVLLFHGTVDGSELFLDGLLLGVVVAGLVVEHAVFLLAEYAEIEKCHMTFTW